MRVRPVFIYLVVRVQAGAVWGRCADCRSIELECQQQFQACYEIRTAKLLYLREATPTIGIDEIKLQSDLTIMGQENWLFAGSFRQPFWVWRNVSCLLVTSRDGIVNSMPPALR
jgi:hypothetical protein